MAATRTSKKKHNFIVVKHNDIIQKTQHALTEQQQNILLYVVSHIEKDDSPEKVYTFYVRDFCRAFNIDDTSGYYYETLKKDIIEIDNQTMIMEKDNEYIRLRWLNVLRIGESEGGYIKYNFTQDIRPYVYELKERFTRYKVKYTMAISGRYGKKLYELLKSYQHLTTEKHFDLDKLKFLLDAENYNRFPDFRRYVLEPAVNEINKYTDIYVRWEKDIPEGQRAVKGIVFTIYPVGNEDMIIERTENLEEKLGYYE